MLKKTSLVLFTCVITVLIFSCNNPATPTGEETDPGSFPFAFGDTIENSTNSSAKISGEPIG